MYSFCAFALPEMSFANWSSARMRLTETQHVSPWVVAAAAAVSEENRQLTTRLLALWRKAFTDCASLLEVNVPILLLALFVLQSEGEDRTALLDGIFALGITG